MFHGLVFVLLSGCLFAHMPAEESDITVSLDVNIDGSTATNYRYAELSTTARLNVEFENKSGFDCILYWVDGDERRVWQADMEYPSVTNVGTVSGHIFMFVLSSEPSTVLYRVRMTPYIDVVTLLRTEQMRAIDAREKEQFYKAYYLQTGRRWKNYYPRNALVWPYLNATHIGQRIRRATKQSQVYAIDDAVMRATLIDANQTFALQLRAYNQQQQQQSTHTVQQQVAGIAHRTFELEQHRILSWNFTEFYALETEESEFELQVLCTAPTVLRITDFLSDDECAHLIGIGTHYNLSRSTVAETLLEDDSARSSSHMWLKRDDSNLVDRIIARVGDMVGIEARWLFTNASAEDLQLVHYAEGQYYRGHHDYGTDSEHNRFITVLLYLNDVDFGGNTSFPRASAECADHNGYFGVRPLKRSALIFYDLLRDANADELSFHEAEPPLNGSEKWMTNLWIWDARFQPLFRGFEDD